MMTSRDNAEDQKPKTTSSRHKYAEIYNYDGG